MFVLKWIIRFFFTMKQRHSHDLQLGRFLIGKQEGSLSEVHTDACLFRSLLSMLVLSVKGTSIWQCDLQN